MFQLIALIVALAAWVTHVVVYIQSASWILLIIGSVIFPIGVIHGLMVWFGAA